VDQTAEIEGALRAALRPRGDVRLALLFGSQARGEAQASSDIDLAVWAPGVDLLELGAELSTALRQEVDIASLEAPTIPLLEQLIRESIVVHEAIDGTAATWRSRALASLETDRPWYARMRDAWLRRVAEQGV